MKYKTVNPTSDVSWYPVLLWTVSSRRLSTGVKSLSQELALCRPFWYFWNRKGAKNNLLGISMEVSHSLFEGSYKKKCGDVGPAFQNPYPIYDQNLWFFLSYLWPGKKFGTLFMTVATDTVALNIIFEVLLLLKRWFLLKNTQNSRLEYKYQCMRYSRPKWPKWYPIYEQNSWKILFLYSPYYEVLPPLWGVCVAELPHKRVSTTSNWHN